MLFHYPVWAGKHWRFFSETFYKKSSKHMSTSVKQREPTPFCTAQNEVTKSWNRTIFRAMPAGAHHFWLKLSILCKAVVYFWQKNRAMETSAGLLMVLSQETTCRMSGIIETCSCYCSLPRPVTRGHTNYRPPPSFPAALSLHGIPSSQTKI